MAGPPALVVDASVAVKWFNPEEGHERALALRDRHVSGRVRLVAPSLLVWEVGNALRYSGELGASDVKRALEALLDLQVALEGPDTSWLEDAVDLAFEAGLTLYDASYLGLARHLGTSVVTADEKMETKAPPGLVQALGTLPRDKGRRRRDQGVS